MELKENDYILGYWFASDNESNCWYMMIIKRDNQWLGQYTFRYNKEKEREKFDPFSGKDEKSIYGLTIDGDEPESKIIENTNTIFNFIKIKFNDCNDHFLVQGNIEKFMEIAKTKHYFHMREENIN